MQFTLKRSGNRLALPVVQKDTLAQVPLPGQHDFASLLAQTDQLPLRANGIEVVQVNVGKVCNQTCSHCHVDAGPDRRESISQSTAQDVVRLLDHSDVKVLDITGGAPEMNPHFRWLVEQARQRGLRVIDRCNLTILLANGFRDLPEFLADQKVEVIASLPCYLEDNCDAQRGSGVFQQSIEALQRLNGLGYGMPHSDLRLSLVYNPVGPTLPPDQSQLEAEYRRQLRSRFQVEFSNLFTITNMPISRFLDDLVKQGQLEDYMEKLAQAFNPHAVDGVMCRSMISVDWQGNLYDCDFNQMLDIPVLCQGNSVTEFCWEDLGKRPIATGNHCLGCTAGAGSSCQGAVA